MTRTILVATVSLLCAASAMADSTNLIESKVDGSAESGWTVAIPSGSSDYFNVRYDGSGRTGGIGLNVADFGAASSYPQIGVYGANLGLDPSGDTPDLGAAISVGFSPPVLGGPLFSDFLIDVPVSAYSGPVHVCAQFPPGDPGLLAIGADTDTEALGGSEIPGSPNPFDSSGFTTDGYSSVSVDFGSGEFGLDLQKVEPGIGPTFRLNGGSGFCGDHVTYTTQLGAEFGTFVSALDHEGGNEVYLMFLSFLGAPIAPVGPVLPLPFSNIHGTTSSIRIGSTYFGAGNITFNLVAVTGTLGVNGTAAVSNEVTVYALPNPVLPFGSYDDGTYEGGWVVQVPSGSSDYFNVNFGDPAASGTTGINGQRIAVMDFGTPVTAYPTSGKTPENLGVDPSGNTPDLGSPYVSQSFPFPPATFCTTANQMVTMTFPTFTPTTPNLHMIVQFPPGDNGLLGVGGDTNSTFISGLSGWTLDGYSTPSSNFFFANWGMRCDGF